MTEQLNDLNNQAAVSKSQSDAPTSGDASMGTPQNGDGAAADFEKAAADVHITDGASVADSKGPISERKLAANRANAQHATGPKTAAGKTRSAQNAYRHGLCARHLFRPGAQGEEDKEAYHKLSARVRGHYRPQGVIAEFLVEKIVTEMVRFGRMIGHEQQELDRQHPFYNSAIDKILRYSTTSERQLMRSIKELERIQAARATTSGAAGEIGAEGGDEQARDGASSEDATWDCLSSIIQSAESANGPQPLPDSSRAKK